MPTYEFKCDTCGYVTTEVFKFEENHIVDCHECLKIMRKVIASAPVILRGTGWGKDK